MAKSKGGVGQRITGKTLRRFSPNLQPVNAIIDGKKKEDNGLREMHKSRQS
jgi:large subunit ribosomal protein L28